ncbi:hypothetical protein BY996DRAFT_6644417 [Phakopsora pachyrhizi]|nr:hypothetical protein BY996DRAFT_6644417 [Phakopsora pachyrhizi]
MIFLKSSIDLLSSPFSMLVLFIFTVPQRAVLGDEVVKLSKPLFVNCDGGYVADGCKSTIDDMFKVKGEELVNSVHNYHSTPPQEWNCKITYWTEKGNEAAFLIGRQGLIDASKQLSDECKRRNAASYDVNSKKSAHNVLITNYNDKKLVFMIDKKPTV